MPTRETLADTAIVDLAGVQGPTTRRGSGILYGLTEDGANPPDAFIEAIGFRFHRAGGAQLDVPGGWVAGTFDRRWASTLAQYRRTTTLGGTFILLVHDLYGADGATIGRWPGDGGDWIDFERFLDEVIGRVRDARIDPQWDLWNEPDLDLFWARPQTQYLELWRRAYLKVRSAFPAATIVGPSSSLEPAGSGQWWNAFLDFASDHDVLPDIVSWHEIDGTAHGQDAVASRASAESMLSSRGVAPRPFQINEYADPGQQNPGQSAWYLARLERSRIDGLRANWGSGQGLHDNLAGLLQRANDGYLPLADWFTYRAYAAQVGSVAVSRPGAQVDVFASLADQGDQARFLVGNHGSVTGPVDIQVDGLAATDVPRGGLVRMIVELIPYNEGRPILGPTMVADTEMPLSPGGLRIRLDYGSARDAFLIRLGRPEAT